MPPRPATPAIHTHTTSVPLSHAPPGSHRTAQAPISWASLEGLPSRKPQTFMISAGPCHQAHIGLHNLRWAVPLTLAQACRISTGTMPLKPAKLAIHRHAGSPLCQPMPFRYAKPMLQRPASLPGKASTCRPLGPHPPATSHRRGPNLPKRHTQTGLDAKGVTSQQLRLQFYCSRIGEFFFPLF
jgi:hypothetical protein